jgi:hypothetical protein
MDTFLKHIEPTKIEPRGYKKHKHIITSSEISAVIKSLSTKKIPEPEKEPAPLLFKLFHNIERKGALPNLLYEVSRA